MIARVLPVLLLLVAAPAMESDPFLAALAGKSGPDAVAAPSFDPDVEASSWTTRPRREIVDALAARLLRGEAKGWYEPAKEGPALPAPPSRIPADFEAGKFEVADRLAAWVPADAAAAFFGSLDQANDAVDGLSKFLPEAFPGHCSDPPGGKRDALRRAVEMLLLPTIWRSNPGVRTGTRQIAVVASDPDLRWAPDIALVAEVDDASLVRFHRASTLSFEDRGLRRLRVDGLDATTDDGSVRSWFALEGGVAVWATTKSLRERILAAGAGKAPTLLSPDPRAYALARRTFPAAEGGALLVVPDAFLARLGSGELRAGRASALRCEAARLLLDVRSLAGQTVPPADTPALTCPGGGVLAPKGKSAASSCSLHGTAEFPVPLGALPATTRAAGPAPVGTFLRAGLPPVAARWLPGFLDVLVPPGPAGPLVMAFFRPQGTSSGNEWLVGGRPLRRLEPIRDRTGDLESAVEVYRAMAGLSPRDAEDRLPVEVSRGILRWVDEAKELSSRDPDVLVRPPPRGTPAPTTGVLRLSRDWGSRSMGSPGLGLQERFIMEWR